MPMPQQQYCLRWNNHRSNLLTVFDELLRNEAFTDVTLACEGGLSVKCHKMVLAACSSYFQCLFSELPCRHPVVVLKDVRYGEMKAILEYMYRGEVSIAQDQLAPLLKVAEALKVKGLVEENSYKSKLEDELKTVSPSSTIAVSTTLQSNRQLKRDTMTSNTGECITRSNENIANSPPHSTSLHHSFPKSATFPYGPTKSSTSPTERSNSRMSLPVWPMTTLPITTTSAPHAASAMFNSCYEAVIAAGNTDMPPLRRKKLSSFLMNRGDTPILRTVLGQNHPAADSSEPMSLVCHADVPSDQITQTNGPNTPQQQNTDYRTVKSESIPEDVHSPYMDSAFIDEDINQERMAKAMHSSSSSPQSFYSESKGGSGSGVSSGIATYVPTQKPEWKRYKQYTRNDIMSAIDAVRNGMSALQAARKYGVPSRTLYDKVKKLGITTSRPFRRSNGSNGAAFPYGITGTGGNMMFGMNSEDESPQSQASSLLDHGFLQHALEMGGKIKMESSERDIMMCSNTSSVVQHGFLQHALQVGLQVTSGTDDDNTVQRTPSPPTSIHETSSRSPNVIKYAQRSNSNIPAVSSPSPPSSLSTVPIQPQSPLPPDDDNEHYEDQVEDLSMSRKSQQTRMIMSGGTSLTTCAND